MRELEISLETIRSRPIHGHQNPMNPQQGKVKNELILTLGLLADVGVQVGTHGERKEGVRPMV
jgi:hypothetical protein